MIKDSIFSLSQKGLQDSPVTENWKWKENLQELLGEDNDNFLMVAKPVQD